MTTTSMREVSVAQACMPVMNYLWCSGKGCWLNLLCRHAGRAGDCCNACVCKACGVDCVCRRDLPGCRNAGELVSTLEQSNMRTSTCYNVRAVWKEPISGDVLGLASRSWHRSCTAGCVSDLKLQAGALRKRNASNLAGYALYRPLCDSAAKHAGRDRVSLRGLWKLLTTLDFDSQVCLDHIV